MISRFLSSSALLAALLAGSAGPLVAQLDGTRVYWAVPINTNILGATAVRGTVNAAWTNLHRVQPSIRIDNSLYFASYSRSFGLFNRSAMASAILPAGAIGTAVALPPGTPIGDDFVHGVGDPSLGLWINLLGAPELPVREFLRFEQSTTVSFSATGTVPLGQYDPQSPLNIGGNQWKLRLGLPIVHALGAWVPGSRTTLEVFPAWTIVGDNSDALGQTVSQDPTFSLETHLTRDVTSRAFLSLDYSFLRLGASTYTDNQSGAVVESTGSTEAHLMGATMGFEINENLRLFVTHMQTASDDMGSFDLSGELLKVMLSWSWHTVLERTRQLN